MSGLIDLSPAHLAIVDEILSEYVPDCEVRAFGSRATWTARDYSDLDLAVVSDGPLGWRTIGHLKEAFEESTLPMRVDVVDWHDIKASFRQKIEPDCVVIRPRLITPTWRPSTIAACAALVRDTVSPADCGQIPYIGLEHIGEGTLQLTGLGAASKVVSPKTRFKRGDILFGKLRPYFRKVVRPQFDGICSTDIWVVRPSSGVDAGYLFYLMASQAFIEIATRGSEGTRMPRAKWEHVSRFEFELPNLREQRAIARVLRALDDKIELNRRMSETLDEMARTLFRSWFVNFDPVHAKAEGRSSGLPRDLDALFPDSFEPSELGDIPVGWQAMTLGQISHKPQYGYTQSATDEDIGPQFLRITDINKKPWVDWDLVPHCEISDGDYEKYRLHKGDVLIARMADPGHGCMIEEQPNAVFASYLIRFRPVDVRYERLLQYWLRSDSYWQLVVGRGAGTTRRTLNARVLSEFPLVIPPLPLLDSFRESITNLRTRVVANVAETRVLRSLRDALLPKLLSGELRVMATEDTPAPTPV